MAPSQKFHYDYSQLAVECSLAGLKWDERILDLFDPIFKSQKLEQRQVEAIVRGFIHLQVWQWSPANHTALSRLKVALWFLFGGSLVPKQ